VISIGWPIMLAIGAIFGAYIWILKRDHRAARSMQEARRVANEGVRDLRMENAQAEAQRLHAVVRQLEEENRDLRANQSMDDYRTVTRRRG
jgi:hypothetical protein